MNESNYGLRMELPLDYERAVERTIAALKEEGFGVLTTIDVRRTLKEKLDADFRRYIILGACNPPLASRALQAETEIGLLLPCNVIVYESGEGRSIVAALAPQTMIRLVGENAALAAVAGEADQRLRRALHRLDVPTGQ
ncbi:MAG: DUF302 domain-containing protein [Acidobacteria bacterium]|nr:DUF302 domain-containing protein [Acidobacteriota bacterium]